MRVAMGALAFLALAGSDPAAAPACAPHQAAIAWFVRGPNRKVRYRGIAHEGGDQSLYVLDETLLGGRVGCAHAR